MNDKFLTRAREIVSQLTEAEKLQMLSTHHAPVERLGLGEFYIGTEAARGYVGRDKEHTSTVLPQPVGMASTFDRGLMKALGQITGTEARAYYNREKRGGLCLWGPTVDMVRDPRWGRTEEAYGEDVFLAGELTAAYTKGMAGEDSEYLLTLPALKHFCANNNEERRGSCSAYLPPRLKYEYYYAAFENAIRWGGAKSVMAAYNEINGLPAIMNPELKTMLREQWGLWFAVSDGGDFSMNVTAHRYTESLAESYPLSLKAGCDVMTDAADLVAAAAKKALDEGIVSMEDIDESLVRTIYARLRLGHAGGCKYDDIGDDVIGCKAHRELDLRAAREQVVLLKNDGILPVKDTSKKAAVLGPMADDILMDWYTGYADYEHTILESLRAEFASVICDKLWDRVTIKSPEGKYLSIKDEEAFACADEPEVFELQDWGEGWCNLFSEKVGRYLRMDDSGKLLLHNRRVFDWFTRETLNFKAYGNKFIIEEYLDHRRLTRQPDGSLRFEKHHAVTAEQLWEVDIVDSGRERAERLAAENDIVIYCVGNCPTQVAKECYDRRTLALNIQPGMTQLLSRANPETVLCIVSSYPYSVVEESKAAAAVIWTSHAGAELGTAVSEVITGKYSPAGRLPLTWYKSEYDLPDIMDYDIENAGSTYMYFKGEPLYPFGHGLSYGSFEYSGIKAVQTVKGALVTLEVKNTSDIACDEVVQVYFTVEDSAVTRPIKKLCGFERVHFEPLQQRTVEIEVPDHILRIYDVRRQKMIVEGGRYLFMAGASSSDIRLTARLDLAGESLGARADDFPAVTFDSCKGTKIFTAKDSLREYVRCTEYAGSVTFGGADLRRAKAVRFTASSLFGRRKAEIEAGNNKLGAELSPSDSWYDFSVYEVSLPEDIGGDTLTFHLAQGCGLLDISIVR
ncbi:glycoside hydrolase family 3 C-terminal domain-containing protein [Ruminococcus sp.]|uniref:beta-glucosidase n=1 Tax=Ruminococcus sp. TaxID=41978 RepID=UPI0025D6B931|nr:glycoside hydrolase family 3 C-terminal domain-containing protein [Ruminococcus sp.]MBQ8965040.1 glycoside hydrolase family 3 C-terminal domain-containing protein [Ruminococcus sp.]